MVMSRMVTFLATFCPAMIHSTSNGNTGSINGMPSMIIIYFNKLLPL